ncbi:alpha-D-ribose 1-methylphosphonate 5-triphosphate synthase subunit PhnG [Pararhizobium capsulatum DSM 1112]|uniref:Alpha-D-ribose 1-methylphosphonate 5-triphosphate synthase subunit PhnG n=1 Tax=Pararhizobium capsulatum DSM 1112 TaxID=1121113 RepID=A0ABU0BK41_9HYPH|nr:phosphonate C-P lyase system protein PhnG [Pararhizobium capsulatum]MDQ0318099.1 alpha-D-ribose 1-methylphosphonate 5-triphosphate synthase subunit PhnG [Pararhizobium capsulatum DSM 1112]
MDAIGQELNLAQKARQRVIGLLAKATRQELEAALENLGATPAHDVVRGPETGLVMVRGQIGGGGAPFNLGEATVSRATIQLASGEVGHGQVLGTDRRKALLAALFDALGQADDHAPAIGTFVDGLEARIAADDLKRAEQTAATRVDFFTMVRGDD